ncbi:hypothetical protein K438DRAFT_639885 [Mycena galopus ATCC 62051]|nr:hypothetical protein K438DRAFT_639885 [Mycena galopus ATCC 62051]
MDDRLSTLVLLVCSRIVLVLKSHCKPSCSESFLSALARVLGFRTGSIPKKVTKTVASFFPLKFVVLRWRSKLNPCHQLASCTQLSFALQVSSLWTPESIAPIGDVLLIFGRISRPSKHSTGTKNHQMITHHPQY